MNFYVICPKTSSNEEVSQEFGSDYGFDNVDGVHVQHVESDRATIVKHFSKYMNHLADKEDYEIRKLTVTCSGLD